MSVENGPNLASLPADAIRRIIKECSESLEIVRLISPRWNSLVRECIQSGIHLAPIDSVLLTTNLQGNAVLKLWFHPKYRIYFGVDDWLSWPVDGADGKPSDLRMFECIANDAGISDIPHIFRRCSAIANLELDMDVLERKNKTTTVMNAINGVHVQECRLVFPIHEGIDSTHRILDMLHSRFAHQLVLSTKDFDSFNLLLEQLDYGIIYAAAAQSNTAIELRVDAYYGWNWNFPFSSYDVMIEHCEEKMDVHVKQWNVNGRLEVQRMNDERVRVSILIP